MLEIKNTSKIATVFHIVGKGVMVNEKIKLNPDESKKLRIKFVGKAVGKYEVSVVVTPRGGQMKVLETTINVIQPKIVFSQEEIGLGILVVQGISGLKEFTLCNKSEIELPLIIDVRSRKYKSDNP